MAYLFAGQACCSIILEMLNKLVPPVYAACSPGSDEPFNLGDCLKLSGDQPISEKYTDIGFLINLIVQNIFVLGTIILFFMLVYAGFRFVVGGKKGLDDSKAIMTTAIAGFLIMFTSYWIVQLIKIITGIDIPI